MAKRRGLAPQHDEHVNVTPLIDVVMCLIIFFMLCGRMVQGDVAAIAIPGARMGTPLEEQKSRLFINLVPQFSDDDKKIGASKPEHFRSPDVKARKEPILQVHGEDKPFTDLAKILRDEKAANPEIRLVIRADRDLHYRYISPIIVACAMADIKSLNFATETEATPKSN